MHDLKYWQDKIRLARSNTNYEDLELNYFINNIYDFLVKYGLPLPELHRLDRVKLNLAK